MNIPEATIKRLCTLLEEPYDPALCHHIALHQVQSWKSKAEALARAHDLNTEEVISLIIQIAKATQSDAHLALAYWIVANMHYRLGKHQLADEAFSQAAVLYRQQNKLDDIARMSVGWVIALSEAGEYTRALQVFSEAKATLTSSTDSADQARLAGLYGNAGIVYEALGQFERALASYDQKWDFYQRYENDAMEAVMEAAATLNSMGITQTLLGKYLLAEQTFEQGVQLLLPHISQPDVPVYLTHLYMNRAWLESLRQSPVDTVKRAFSEAQRSRHQLLQEDTSHYFGLIDLDEANWLIHLDDWRNVNRHNLEESVKQFEKSGLAFEKNYALLLLGQLHVFDGEARLAQEYFNRIDSAFTEQNPGMAYLKYMWQARALHALGQLAEAQQVLVQGIDHIEQTRHNLTVDDYRAGYLEDKLVAYQDLVALHLETRDYVSAFAISERAKARTLTETLANQANGSRPTEIPIELVSLKSITGLLAPNTIAISYAIIHGKVWAFLLARSGLLTEPIALGPTIDLAQLNSGFSKIQRIIHRQPSTGAALEKQIATAQKALAMWHTHYVAPLERWLEPFANLLISPDGLLNALPFASFYNEKQEHYLLESYSITVAPSLGVWATIGQNQLQITQSSSSAIYKIALIVGNSSKAGVPNSLPHTTDEARTVASCFPNFRLLLEQAATVDQFLHQAPCADLIYLAAHGEYRVSATENSFIELWGGQLSLDKILSLQLSSPLVILSACETSKGHLTGNEMMGLVRAFLYAGAKAVVATYWPVEDRATHDLMTRLVKEVQNDKPLSQALRETQQAFIKSRGKLWSHPYYWGAAMIFGSDGTTVTI